MTTSTEGLLERVLAVEEPDDDTVRAILDATREQIRRFGLRRLTMDDVAEAAGVGRATVYRRVGSRDEVIEAVILRELRSFIAEVDRTLEGLPTERWVVEGFAATLAAARENPLLQRLLTIEQDVALPYLTVRAAPGIAVAREFLARRIRAAQSAGEAPDFDPEPVAELLVRLCQSLLLTPDGRIPSGDDPEASRAFARAYLRPIITGQQAPADAGRGPAV